MIESPFILFGYQHLIILFLSVCFIIFFPLFVKNKFDIKRQELISRWIAYVLIIHETSKPFYRSYFFGDSFLTVLPLHLCNLSAFSIATYLLTRKKVFFEIAYFWGLSGGTMALITPELDLAFPDIEWFPFFIGHSVTLMGVFYSIFCHNIHPSRESLKKVILISCGSLVIIFIINTLLGPSANYWYLNSKPNADSLMNFMPSPPFHIPIAILIAFGFFYLLNIPYRKKYKKIQN